MTWTADSTGNNYLFPTSTSSSSSLSGAYGVAVSVGDVLVAFAATDNVQTTDGTSNLHTALSDDAGNTYTKIGEYTKGSGAAGSGVTASAWFCRLAHAVTTSNHATLTLASAVTAKSMAASRFISDGSGPSVSGTTQYASSSTSSGGSLTLSDVTSGAHLFCRVTGVEYNATGSQVGVDSGWSRNNTIRTNTGAADANVAALLEFRIVTGASPTSNANLTVTADNIGIMFALSDAATGTATTLDLGSASPPGSRDYLAQPFSQDSIWNMPIGSGAVFVASNLNGDPTDPANSTNTAYAPMPSVDPEHIILSSASPLTDVDYSSAGWSGTSRCAATGGLLFSVPIPTSYVVPSSNENDGAAILAADGHTIKQCQPFARCSAGGVATAMVTFADVDLYSTGITGGHGGSGLSSIGGSLRVGELRPGQQGPKHALKLNVYARQFLYKPPQKTPANYSTGGVGGAYRWPATTADSYWANSTTGYGANSNAVNNANQHMCMGALLAIPSTTDINTLGLVTEPGKQLAWTLQNYGAYIVDDTASPAYTFSVEDGPNGSKETEFQNDFGFALAQRKIDGTNWVHDIQKLMTALRVVSNNSPTAIGGGGTPLQPLIDSQNTGYTLAASDVAVPMNYVIAAQKAALAMTLQTADMTFGSSQAPTLIALFDNFDDNAIDAAKWLVSVPSSNSQVLEQSQQLQILPYSGGGEYSFVSSQSSFDFSDKGFFAKLIEPLNSDPAGADETFFGVGLFSDLATRYNFYFGGATVNISAVYYDGTGSHFRKTVAYVPSTHAWLRVRYDANLNVLVLETAPADASDPPVESDWVEFDSMTPSFSMASITPIFAAGCFAAVTSPGAAIIDGFNTATSGVVNALTLVSGPFTYSGKTATLAITENLVMAAGSLTFGSQSATLAFGVSVAPTKGTFTMTPFDGIAAYGVVYPSSKGSYALSGVASDMPMVTYTHGTLDATTGVFSFSTFAAAVTLPVDVVAVSTKVIAMRRGRRR